MIKVQEIKITKVAALKGGSQISWNVDLNGKPFGQIWTFKAMRGYRFQFVAKRLNGSAKSFHTYDEAERYMRGLM